MKPLILISFASMWLAEAAPAAAQTPAPPGPRFDTVLYGASYYHEYMPAERLDKDVELMQRAGLTVVRLGESTWSSWEPRDGRFEYAWMERILDRLHKAGIKVILGTPTYSVPPWLWKAHPEILLTDVAGKSQSYGMRQNMDLTHPVYRKYAERVIRHVVEHFKDHPAVIGYQVDNETDSYGTAGKNVQAAFVEHCKRKFKTVAELNRRWGLAYWGQLLSDWSEIPPREGIVNPGWKLEWERFQRDIPREFLAWQVTLVNGYKRPDQFVMHDFAEPPRVTVDEREISRTLDVAAVNNYHAVQDDFDGFSSARVGDFTRSLKGQNYLVTETNAQGIGWDSRNQFPPYDGQIRLAVYGHVASGANLVAYWHWHSLHYGQETYWKGVLGHDLEPNRVFYEVGRVARELKEIGPRLCNLKKQSRVAVLYSVDSYWGLRFMPFSGRVGYMDVLDQMYRALFRLNVGVDFVFPASTNLSDYAVVVVPPLYIASDELLQRLADYAAAGGHLVLGFKSGFADEDSTIRAVHMPGPLRAAIGASYQEFSNLKKPIPLQDDPFKTGDENKVSEWAEFLVPETATALAKYDHPFFGRWAALTRNKHGKGTVTYEATVLTDKLQEKVLAQVLGGAGLLGPDQMLPAPVRVRHGVGGASGKAMHHYLNYSASPQTFVYAYGAGTNLLGGKAIDKQASLTLGP